MILCILAGLFGLLALTGTAFAAGEPPLSALTLVGPAAPVFVARRDACDGADVPDAPARAFRDGAGAVALFGMHYRNRALRGPDLDHLKIDCRVVLDSGERDDPALYDDRSWITATWTDDGRHVAALLHHEYQANEHAGRCRSKAYMECWYNTVLGAASTDAGLSFSRAKPPVVVAGAPFRQEVDQGRHRGFFNPSNIFSDGRYRYFLASTTGWDRPGSDQEHGVCLFRTETPADPASWRAWTGTGFTAAFPDPYRTTGKRMDTCKPVAPFPAPVGAVVRHRGTGAFIAVFMAKAGGRFPQSGFYWTTSRDLLTWDEPRLLLAGGTLYDDPCGAGDGLIAYPSLLDASAQGRNFDDVGDTASLFYATLATKGCEITSNRDLVRRPVAIKVWP
ncbi:hypothetical protein [Methylobacterium gnaphalii]|uniref:Uncharacterized protein n=1 Tax=Methylobacterium gnaphalii TaxID=1010610 RepID=A0A512JFL2_9HYPH|nr:hypothetical protein [Methylobacterium gnaphalii]GEP08737.1 hypothetical protein MGN01_05820 [Methylobacterium gnaphalii]GJD69327.1 hypothetical protein MMMDOFMJ_2257 [Methylobacterium gnaphalii]GLS47503.1 hypothetical protein GCM10007885_03470 [Methylobacterium gnaphalii]